jgi:hypothetical protein
MAATRQLASATVGGLLRTDAGAEQREQRAGEAHFRHRPGLRDEGEARRVRKRRQPHRTGAVEGEGVHAEEQAGPGAHQPGQQRDVDPGQAAQRGDHRGHRTEDEHAAAQGP